MSEELKPCPCGKTPAYLCIMPGDTCKWAWVSGSCCSDWHTEMRTDYLPLDDARLMVKAAECWNLASRPAPVQVPSGWKLVPIEATEAMLEAIANTVPCMTSDARLAYRAMLAAAPAPATVATEPVARGGGVDVEKVIGLVTEYGDAMFAAGISCAHHEHRNEREYRDDADEAKAQIRALLTAAPAANQEGK